MIVFWLSGAGLASAQTPRGWTGAGGNPFWSNPANWLNNAVPQPDAGEIVVFPAGVANKTIIYDVPKGGHYKQLTFGDTYTMSGNDLAIDEQITVSGGASTVSNKISIPNDHPLAFDQIAGASLTIQLLDGVGGIVKSGAGTLIVTGTSPFPNLFFGVTTVVQGTLLLEKQNGGAVTQGLVVGDDVGAPESAVVIIQGDDEIEGAITVNPSGVLFLAQNFNHHMTGSLTIKSGIIQTGTGTLFLGGDVTVPDGATLGSIQGNLSLGDQVQTFTVAVQTDNTVPAVLCGSSGVVTFTGTFTLAGGVNQFAPAPGCTLRLGFIEGAGDLVVNGAGNGVVFSGQNGNTGKTLVAAGTLRSQPPGRPSEDSAITMANATLDLHDTKAEQRLLSLAGSGQVLLGDASTIVTTPLDTTFSGSISGDATLVKMGAGNWTLTGQLPFSGVINIRNGSLTVDGSLAGGVVLNTFEKGAASSVLYGVGTIGAIDTEDGGRLQPGHATEPGRLTSQSIDLKPSVTFGAIVNDVKPGTGYSQLVVKGTVTLVGAVLDLKVNPSFVSALAAGAVPDLVLIDNDGTDPIDGTFLDLPEGAIVTSNTGVQFRISYVGGTGNDVTLTPRGNEFFLSEGSTGSFFDTDVLIANPFPTATPITIKFLKDDGTTVSIDRTLGGSTRMTVHVNEVAGMNPPRSRQSSRHTTACRSSSSGR